MGGVICSSFKRGETAAVKRCGKRQESLFSRALHVAFCYPLQTVKLEQVTGFF